MSGVYGVAGHQLIVGSKFVSGQWQPTRWSHADARPPITIEDPPRPLPIRIVAPEPPKSLL